MTPRENPHLFGHEAAEAAFRDTARLHHAWLITGPEGVGRATLAHRIARVVLAGSAAAAADPDHPVFRRTAAGTHADLRTLQRPWDEKKKRLLRDIPIDAVREIPPFLRLTPAEGGWRVVIIDGVEDTNRHSQNGLLKMLEEPPARALLLLVASSPGALLPTIRSRTRHLPLRPLGEDAMQAALATLLPDQPAIARRELAAAAGGAPGRAVQLASEGGLAIAALVAETVAALPDLPPRRAYAVADQLRDEAAFETFLTLLRKQIAAAVTRGPTALTPLHPTARWLEIWSVLGRLQTETLAFNLERRQAVVAALALLAGDTP